MAKHLIVIYGPPLAGKTTVAWALARSFEEKAVVVGVDALLGGSSRRRAGGGAGRREGCLDRLPAPTVQ